MNIIKYIKDKWPHLLFCAGFVLAVRFGGMVGLIAYLGIMWPLKKYIYADE